MENNNIEILASEVKLFIEFNDYDIIDEVNFLIKLQNFLSEEVKQSTEQNQNFFCADVNYGATKCKRQCNYCKNLVNKAID